MTALAFADRVQETAQNVGAGSVGLLGAAAANLRTFAAGGLDGEMVPYCIQHRTSSQWEVGYGIFTAPAVLTRVVVLSNSLGNTSHVNFSSGVVDVWNDIPAEKFLSLDTTNALDLPGDLNVAGALTAGSTANLGVVSAGTWQAGVVAGQYGGTGVANTGSTITVGGNVAIVGAHNLTLTIIGDTALTLPTTGTIVTDTVTTLSNLASIGTITTGVWQGTVVASQYGGTGVNNGSFTLTMGGSISTAGTFATSGAHALTFTLTADTNVTLPTSGTLVNTAVTTLSSLSTVGTIGTGIWQGTSIATTYTDAKVKTVTGTVGTITISGTATDPIWTISAAYAGQNTIVTLGTIATGVWNGASIGTTYTDAKVVSISGVSNRTTVSGTTTVPIIDINAAYVGQSSITTLGTITTGVWNGTAITNANIATGLDVAKLTVGTTLPSNVVTSSLTALGTVLTGAWAATAISAIHGGTGVTSYATGDTLYASAANTLSALAGNTTTVRQFLASTGTGVVANAPAWITIVSTDVSDATSANTPSVIVARNASGNFSAGTITAALTGNASTATALATGRTLAITGDLAWTSPSFDGSGNVTAAGTLATVASAGTTGSSTAIPVITINAKGLTTSITTAAVIAPAGTVTGTTLASNVVTSSLTTIGTLVAGAVPASLVTTGTFPSGTYGFTGATTLTGGAGNFTLISGTGNSRTMILQTTTSGGVATTWLTGNADQTFTFAGGGSFGGAITGAQTFSGAVTLSAALTYGGVTLSNAVTGTGNMVLSASPTLTGTAALATASFAGGGTQTQSVAIGTNGGATTYGALTFLNNLGSGSAAYVGLTGGGGTDKNLYALVPTGGVFQFHINDVNQLTIGAAGAVTFTGALSGITTLHATGLITGDNGLSITSGTTAVQALTAAGLISATTGTFTGVINANAGVSISANLSGGPGQVISDTDASVGTDTMINFVRNGSTAGSITTTLGLVTAYNTTSDERLKRDLGAVPTHVLAQLHVRYFERPLDGSREIGFFAQETYPLTKDRLPHLVTPGTTLDNPWQMDYSKLIPEIVLGWQDHEARIIALEQKLAA